MDGSTDWAAPGSGMRIRVTKAKAETTRDRKNMAAHYVMGWGSKPEMMWAWGYRVNNSGGFRGGGIDTPGGDTFNLGREYLLSTGTYAL